MPQQLCPNLNHRRATITIRHCPHCGDVLNARIVVQPCQEAHHVQQRRRQSMYCVDCGLQLRKPT
jgi:hypothetical protein